MQTTLFSEEQIPFLEIQPTSWRRNWSSALMLQKDVSVSERLAFQLSASEWTSYQGAERTFGKPHSRCSQPLWSFGIHSFIYALTDELHKKLCRRDFSLESFTLFDASSVFTVTLHESVLGN